MTSEKNTIPASLATVKHGRCVQLATVPYDRARELIGDAYNAGTHGIGYSQQAMELHDAVITAQPSPGGQGSALLEQVARFLDYSTGHDPWPNIRRVYGDSWWESVNKMRDELRALAAHPPVRIYGCCAQPEGELHTAECPNMRHLAARQPVGVPARLPSHTVDGELSVASAIDQVLELFPSSGRAALQTLAGLFTHPTIYRYATPTAQAVDLEQFRAQVAELLRSEFDLEVADPEDHRHDDGAGEADRIASKIAALLDSQAVGNG